MKKIILSTEELKKALKKLSQVILKNPVIPALSNIYLRASLGQVELIASDLELTISYVCKCECKKEFEMLIPFEYISKLIGLLPSQPMEIELLAGNKGRIAAEGDVYQLGSLDKIENFPKIPDIPKKKSITVDAAFMEWLDRAMASVGKDKDRPALSKALLEFGDKGITIVSTDAHAIFRYFYPAEVPGPEQILISPKIAKALQGFEKTTISWHAQHVALQADNITIIATRPNDKYPDYKVVIPNHKANLELHRLDLINVLNRAGLANGEDISFQFPADSGSKFTLHAFDTALGRISEVSATGAYTKMTKMVNFAPELFKTLLHQIPFDTIRLHIDGPMRGVLISAEEDGNYLGMIQPLHKQ